MKKLWSTIEEMLIHNLHHVSKTFDDKPYEHRFIRFFCVFLERVKRSLGYEYS